jgi:branched-chain amino acid transport system ATP-binding protein
MAETRSASPPVLATFGLTRSFGGLVAVRDVSISLRQGELHAIIGPNGAGKTTLVNMLSGLSAPTNGRVRFKGADVKGLGPVRLARLGLARSFQLVNVFPGLTVADTLAVAAISRLRRGGRLWASLAGDGQIAARVREVAALFGLGDRLGRPARTLAQGDKKLLDVASAFALQPEVIVLDEPTSGVSTGDKHGIMKVLVSAAARVGIRAIIQVEHDMDIVFGYSDRIVALHEGRVLADGAPAVVRADERVVATVLGKPRH